MKKLEDLTEKEFVLLKTIGMLWEFYPEAPEQFREIKPGIMECEPSIMRWVAVTESVPEKNNKVLLYARPETSNMYQIMVGSLKDSTPFTYKGSSYWADNFESTETGNTHLTVTHWMELPEPPMHGGYMTGEKT